MVDYIVREYGPAMGYALSYYNGNVDELMRMYYNDAYLTAVMSADDHDAKIFIKRTVDDEGNITSTKARYDELVETCIDKFNGEIAAYLRSLQFDQARRIFTVKVLGYENRTLKILINTDGPIIP